MCGGRCASVSLSLNEPWRFLVSQWQNPVKFSFAYVCYRSTVAVFFLLWTLIDAATYGQAGQRRIWLVHITNWSKLLVVADSGIQALSTCYYQLIKLRRVAHANSQPVDVRLSKAFVFVCQCQWLVTGVSGVFALITANVAFIENDTSGAFHAARYFSNVLYVVVDHMVHAQPKRLAHLVYPLSLHVLYILVNLTFAMTGGQSADGGGGVDGVDWAQPALACGYVTLSLLLVVASHTLLWALAKLRQLLYTCCSEQESIPLGLAREQPQYGTKSAVEGTVEEQQEETTALKPSGSRSDELDEKNPFRTDESQGEQMK